jgi:hypothetical protein
MTGGDLMTIGYAISILTGALIGTSIALGIAFVGYKWWGR